MQQIDCLVFGQVANSVFGNAEGSSGAEEIRTPDLLSAIQALSQLSYRPRVFGL